MTESTLTAAQQACALVEEHRARSLATIEDFYARHRAHSEARIDAVLAADSDPEKVWEAIESIGDMPITAKEVRAMAGVLMSTISKEDTVTMPRHYIVVAIAVLGVVAGMFLKAEYAVARPKVEA